MTQIFSFRDLSVWQKSRALTVSIYRITEQYPRHEMFGLSAQMRRTAVSIVANIAEGSARRTSGALANHLDIAIGSASELLALLYVSEDVGYLSAVQRSTLLPQIEEVVKMLHGLHASIRKKMTNA